MKLLLIGLLVSANIVHAGYIRPDISWSQTVINTSGAAAAQNDRDNSVGLWLLKTEDENLTIKKTNDSRTRYLATFASNEKGSAELLVGDSSYTYTDNSKDYSKIIFGNAGINLDKFSFGVNGFHVNSDDYNVYLIGASGAYKVSDLISVGAGVNRSYSNSSDFEYKSFYGGVAISQDKYYLVEVVYKYQPDAKKDNSSVSEDSEIIASGIYHTGRTELKGIVSNSVEKDDNWDEEYKESSVNFEFEYKLSDMLFLGALIGRSNRDYDDSSLYSDDYERVRDTFGFKGRVKVDKVQVEGRLITEKTNTDYTDASNSDEEDESVSAQLYATYFF
jgi:hypothetical protein